MGPLCRRPHLVLEPLSVQPSVSTSPTLAPPISLSPWLCWLCAFPMSDPLYLAFLIVGMLSRQTHILLWNTSIPLTWRFFMVFSFSVLIYWPGLVCCECSCTNVFPRPVCFHSIVCKQLCPLHGDCHGEQRSHLSHTKKKNLDFCWGAICLLCRS